MSSRRLQLPGLIRVCGVKSLSWGHILLNNFLRVVTPTVLRFTATRRVKIDPPFRLQALVLCNLPILLFSKDSLSLIHSRNRCLLLLCTGANVPLQMCQCQIMQRPAAVAVAKFPIPCKVQRLRIQSLSPSSRLEYMIP